MIIITIVFIVVVIIAIIIIIIDRVYAKNVRDIQQSPLIRLQLHSFILRRVYYKLIVWIP